MPNPARWKRAYPAAVKPALPVRDAVTCFPAVLDGEKSGATFQVANFHKRKLKTCATLPAVSASRGFAPSRNSFSKESSKFFVKGVTYGPFKPDAEGNYLGHSEQLDSDLALMREAGVNLVRIYHPPPLWFLDRCAAADIRVLITLPWSKHIEFLRKRSARQAIIDSLTQSIEANAGHSAIFGYLVGNEISSTMVRWLGVRQVTEFVETLVRVGRAIDPGALFSYATYPPTEYLLPQNLDFFCFNVYLHNQREFERYLLRLQNLTEEQPLILGEFGMDTIRHSQDEQAEMLGWHIESVIRCGLAGTILFAWTDEWFTGEQEITDWAFGIVTRERRPKKAFYARQREAGTRPPRDRPAAPPHGAVCFGDCLFLQWRTDPGRLFGVVRQTGLSELRNHPGR